MHHYAYFPLFDFSVTEVTCMTVEVKGTACGVHSSVGPEQ